MAGWRMERGTATDLKSNNGLLSSVLPAVYIVVSRASIYLWALYCKERMTYSPCIWESENRKRHCFLVKSFMRQTSAIHSKDHLCSCSLVSYLLLFLLREPLQSKSDLLWEVYAPDATSKKNTSPLLFDLFVFVSVDFLLFPNPIKQRYKEMKTSD